MGTDQEGSTLRHKAASKAPVLIVVGAVTFLGPVLFLGARHPAAETSVVLLSLRIVGFIGLAAVATGGLLWKDYRRRLQELKDSNTVSTRSDRLVKRFDDANEEAREKERLADENDRAFYKSVEVERGELVISRVFDHRRIEIFSKGYVRVGGWRNTSGGAFREFNSKDPVVAYDTPFEKLHGIKSSFQIQDKSAGGRYLASKATGGLSRMASNEKRIVFLTITTDKTVHTLNQTGGMTRAQDSAAMALEGAGQAILEAMRAEHAVGGTRDAQPAGVTEQLSNIAALHQQGVLTDEEFSDAKAKLLGRL